VVLAIAVIALVFIVNNRSGDDEETTTEATGAPDITPEAKLSREQVQELVAKLSREQVQVVGKRSREQVQEVVAKLSPEQVQELAAEGNIKAKLSPEQVQELKRDANHWASSFATNACNRYMGQPLCERLGAPVSAAFQNSFAGATVEDIIEESERIELVGRTDPPYYLASVKFSNGEVVMFSGGTESFTCAGAGSGCTWIIAEPEHNRRFLEAAQE
jgi:hypothetical protein